jgi:hypothetical protein
MPEDEEAPGRAADSMARLRRRTRTIAPWLVASYAVYLLAGNLLLNSPIGRSLANLQPHKFVASWSGGWTLYPGHVHVENLKIAGHVRRTVWSVQADTSSGRVALLPLLWKEVRFPRVDANGLTGGVTRIDTVRESRAPGPGGWTLRFDRIVGRDIRSAYLNDFVLAGEGRAEVGFMKTLRGGPMELAPSSASFVHGILWRDGQPLARDAAFRGRFAIERHTRAEAHGIERLGKTDIDLTLEATTAGIALNARQGGKPIPALTQGPGRLAGHILWQRGSLGSGTALALSLPVTNDLTGTQKGSEAIVSVTVDNDMNLVANLEPLPGSTMHADAELRVSGRTIPLSDISSLKDRATGHLGAEWHFASLAWLPRLLPGSRLVSFDGAGSVLADIRIVDGEVAVGSSLEIPQVSATALALGNRFDGEARAIIRYEATDGAAVRPRLDASLREFRIAAADEPAKPFVHGRDLQIEASTVPGPGDVRDAATLRGRTDARLTFRNAEIPDLRAYNRYLPSANLRFEGGSGTLSGDLRFIGEGNVGTGEISLNGRDVLLSLAGLTLQGDVAIDTRMRRADLDTREFNADGSRIALRRVRVRGADDPPDDWWAEIALDESRLDWDRPMNFDGRMRLRMKDVGVLLDVYAQRKDLPTWVGKLVNAGEATAQGRVQWRDNTVLLQPLEASNDRFDVLARLRLKQKAVVGDLFARWGVLSLGVELADGKHNLHLVGARKWFDGRPALPPP